MFDQLKDKAGKAKEYGVNKFTTTRDHMKSQPSKNLNWNVDHRAHPPPPPAARPKNTFAPPPSRSGSSSSSIPARSPSEVSPSPSNRSPLAPPPAPPRPGASAVVRKTTRPSDTSPSMPPPPPSRITSSYRTASPHHVGDGPDHIDWANLSPEDKEVFFSWLDEFFARYLSTSVPPSIAGGSVKILQRSPQTSPHPAPPSRASSTMAPPQVPKWSRPPLPTAATDEQFMTSHPAPTQHGSAALDLACYFSSSAHWDSAWYASDNPLRAPPLEGNTQIQLAGSMEQHGLRKMVYGGVLFADLSICWFTIEFPTNGAADPNDARAVKRAARYLPRPLAMDRAALVDAHERYSETIAAFAESFEESGQYCGRGECWDLAHQALEYFQQFDYVPRPVTSIWRTHGHLIFEGKATGRGGPQYGRWRGGDDRVRRGDIVEWRRVKFGMSMGWQTVTQVLGDPDHTAIIVGDAVPAVAVADGQSVKPAELGTLEVVEQSVSTGQTPHRSKYVLSGLEEGEMWIYRPVSMEAYVGCFLEAKCPEGINAQSI
ncbi:uncharacterized protein LAESUDRAFT_702502 [Laetiporus sulphureus 93-53]|uniref:BBC1/AIM3 cysteine proteinase-fold domain-containing protein n=1 Tax=Laetiporus sulphureus 93-53 TaxID=1314785 RepID=A0A165DNK1_9APHY|nr:uncharacterized protein LAESUDRAFT_702502 [Laetiporus sulphureus 93-53]KZT05275.1 hypothetical protein LAESUDRAFT_702502 [Laetiporus sulphureus 93-53]